MITSTERKAFSASAVARVAASAALGVALLGGASQVLAAEIRLLSAAAMQSVFRDIIGDFERASGHKVITAYATMGAITQRVSGGETADLVIGSTQSISTLVLEGRISAGSTVKICKTGVGIVVPSGTPRPRVASAEDLKQALLGATTVVYADPAGGGAAGIHVAKVIQNLGIAEQLKPKTRFGAGGDVTEVTLAQGSGALGMTQISEIVRKTGAEFVGPFPEELQNYTGVTAGVPTGAGPSAAVRAFIAFLKSPAAVAAIHARGMQTD
jgi:molybdate transport system substrate-binding protein